MKPSNSSKTRSRLASKSLQSRLPLLICLLLLVTVAIFIWTSYEGVKAATLATGKERLYTLTAQMSSMFQESAKGIKAITHNIASQEKVRNYVANGAGADSEVRSILERLRSDNSVVSVQLWNDKNQDLLNEGLPASLLNVSPDLALPGLSQGDSSAIGKMIIANDTVYYPVIATIVDQKRVVGYLIDWKMAYATPQALAQLSALIGTNAKFYFGNTDGSVWTDMLRPIAAPKFMNDTSRIKEYKSSDGEAMAAVLPIGNTHWMIMVEFSKASLLETANRFLYKFILTGILLIAIGILIAWLISRNITRPLNRLTAAASSISDGNYATKVDLNRRDELGQLAVAFNTMAAQIESAQFELEEKVHERTMELEKVKEAAERASHAKTRFLSSMSHEIRTPLNGILGFTEILSKDTLGKEVQQEYLEHIKTSGELLSKLIGDILDLNKIEEGKLTIENESFHFKQFIESSLHPYKFQINESGVDFVMDIDPSLPDYIISDRHRIHQVLVNLIGNSIKFTKEGLIGIKITGSKNNDRSFSLRMQVYDTGTGIPKEQFEKIFESFTQANDTISRDFGGSGLGLTIVKQLVTAMRGTVSVSSPSPYTKSKSPGGSCFEITLPVEIDVAREHRPLVESEMAYINRIAGRNILVLIVDDNIMNQKLASFLLQKIGCSTEVAGDGKDAILKLRTGKFDIILMDVHMPVMDGYEASQIIRRDLRIETPIIGVTANVFKDDIEKCIRAGMNDHLGKPYVEWQLAAKINKWLLADPITT